ncbi:MAG: thioredoxin domain-containing protein [Ginsengibacter sp.]
MFNQYEPNIKATVAFLKLLKIKVNDTTVNETLQNHPDYPSFLCISDSFNKWNIPNGAGKIEPEKIDELPVPFIAYTNNREFSLVVVSQTDDKAIHFYTKNYNKPTIKSKNDFLKNWTGVYLIAEPNEHSGEKDYEQNKRKALVNSLVPVSLFVLLTGFSFLLLYGTIHKNLNMLAVSATGIYLQYLILFAGVIVTSLLLWYEMDKNNPLLKKVCTGIAKGNCNAILTGKKSKVFSWLSWSEVGFFYFAGGLLVLLFSGNNINNAITIIGLLNILALPYIIFSVFYQWRVAKQWCVLCLGVQVLLLLGGINILSNNLLASFSIISVSFLINAILIYSLPVLLWYTAKPSILRLQEGKNTKREYLRIKFNTEIFETLLKKQKQITLPADSLGIDIGNPAATNTLIKVCNPYCGPCSKAHPKIDELLEEIPNLKVKIIFITPNNEDNLAIKPVSHLLAIDEQSDNKEIIKKALDDWYLPDNKDYELFANKYPMNGELKKQGNQIEAMDKWCNRIDIHFTPTIFINNYQLPDAYSIEDLQYFLSE